MLLTTSVHAENTEL